MKTEIMAKIDNFIEANQKQFFRDIARLVAINSVEKLGENGTPFGSGPKKALDEALKIAHELGLDTRNCEDKIGYACIGGEGDRYLATITHLDVVPAGNGWKADPFVMRDVDGYILGRGVLDDKGPSVICLYALKFIKELGIELNYPIRALLGANEETGMRDVEHYLAYYPAPLFCFSPDADFPLICGEKGIWHGKMKANKKAEAIISINGGVAFNAIPDLCEATVKAEKLESSADVEAVKEGECWHLTAHGIAGHASMPEGTKNAIGIMLDYILDNDVVQGEEKAFLEKAALEALAHLRPLRHGARLPSAGVCPGGAGHQDRPAHVRRLFPDVPDRASSLSPLLAADPVLHRGLLGCGAEKGLSRAARADACFCPRLHGAALCPCRRDLSRYPQHLSDLLPAAACRPPLVPGAL